MENTGKSSPTPSSLRDATPSASERGIRTFGRIHGKKLSARQQWLVDNLLPQLAPTDIDTDTILEIGFGAGEHLLHLARENPDSLIIGAEPFINGVASLLSQMTEPVGAGSARPESTNPEWGGLTPPLQLIKPEYKNIRIWPNDVRKLLAVSCSLLVDKNFAIRKIFILHPDPWPKARHEKRRLLNTEFLNLLSTHLTPNGQIIIGTDHGDLFNWILEQAKAVGALRDPGPQKIVDFLGWSAPLQITIHDSPPENGLDTRYKTKDLFGTKTTKYIALQN